MASPYRYITSNGRYMGEHVAIAERVLGHPLPDGAVVHHVDQNKRNNENTNLVVCPSDDYHHLLHRRQRALDQCGHADWMKCFFCKKWSPPAEILSYPVKKRSVHNAYHQECNRLNASKYHKRKAAEKKK